MNIGTVCRDTSRSRCRCFKHQACPLRCGVNGEHSRRPRDFGFKSWPLAVICLVDPTFRPVPPSPS